ncbi:MAG: ATP-binding protein [Pseudomonadota bacterium]
MPILNVPARLEHLATVNDFINEHLPAEHAMLSMQVELAAEELLVNVFSYAYPQELGVTGKAEVGCRMVHFDGEDFFSLSVKDWGKPFNPFIEAPEPDTSLDIEDRPIGGLGVHLIKTMVSHYSYGYADDANVIELFFALPPTLPVLED